MKKSLWAVYIDECLLVDKLPYVVLVISTLRERNVDVGFFGKVVKVGEEGVYVEVKAGMNELTFFPKERISLVG